jgi:2'-5' RNA ligase
LRSFIAIELPEAVISALSEFQQELKKYGADVRWVKPQNIHLTLKFLGNIDDKDSDRIKKAIEGISKNCSYFDIRIKGTGVFPNMKNPRVLWIGVSENGILGGLQKAIEEAMSSLGFEKEDREFAPHLTLGRFRSSYGKESLLEKIELNRDREFGHIPVRMVSLMKSDLSPAGAKYSRVAEIPLGN